MARFALTKSAWSLLRIRTIYGCPPPRNTMCCFIQTFYERFVYKMLGWRGGGVDGGGCDGQNILQGAHVIAHHTDYYNYLLSPLL